MEKNIDLENDKKRNKRLAIVGFILSISGGFLFAIVGFIISLRCFSKFKKTGDSGIVFSVIGIMASAMSILFYSMMISLVIIFTVIPYLQKELTPYGCQVINKEEKIDELCTENLNGTYNCLFITCDFDNINLDSEN